MLNPLAAYTEAGRKSAEARRQHDEARALFHASWARRAIALEKPEDRSQAFRAFDLAYKDAAGFRPVF